MSLIFHIGLLSVITTVLFMLSRGIIVSKACFVTEFTEWYNSFVLQTA